MPSIYRPRRPRASPLWQIVTAAWDAFVAGYEKCHRVAMGPLRPNVFTTVRNFLRCGDLAAGFTRFLCPACGHEHLLAFTCKGRHFCPACHQRRVRQTAEWIASSVCHEVPHRKFVFTIPKILRGIFHKRRDLLHLLFKTATDTLLESFRARLNLPAGRLAAVAAVHTFGDYLFASIHTSTSFPPTACSTQMAASTTCLPTAAPPSSNSSATAQTALRHRDLRARRATMAGDQGMDSRRRTESELVQPTPETIRARPRVVRPKPGLERIRDPAWRWPHPRSGIYLNS